MDEMNIVGDDFNPHFAVVDGEAAVSVKIACSRAAVGKAKRAPLNKAVKLKVCDMARRDLTPRVERVIFNGPATIVFWSDGGKTVVKCRRCPKEACVRLLEFPKTPLGDFCESVTHIGCMGYDKETAIMAAMLKRLYPNFQDVLREAIGEVGE